MNELEAVRQNKRAVQQRQQALEQELAERRAELAEMRAALTVLDRLRGDPVRQPQRSPRDTVHKRIVAHLRKYGPCTSHQITDGLAAEWRSDLPFATVASTLSRMRGCGVERTDDGLWYVPA